MSCAARSGAITDAWFQPFPGHAWTNQRRRSPSCTVVATGQAAGGFWLAGTHTAPLPAVDRPIPGHKPAGRSDWRRQRLPLQAVVSLTRWQREATSPQNGLVQSMPLHTVRRALNLRRACFNHGEQHEHQQALDDGPSTKECRPRASLDRVSKQHIVLLQFSLFFFLGLFFSLFPWCESLSSHQHHQRLFCQYFLISLFGFFLGIKSQGPYKHLFSLSFRIPTTATPIELGLVSS